MGDIGNLGREKVKRQKKVKGKIGLSKSLAVDAGGSLGDRRNEETSSKYAVGARIKKIPS